YSSLNSALVDSSVVVTLTGSGSGNLDHASGATTQYNIMDIGNTQGIKDVGVDAGGKLAFALGATNAAYGAKSLPIFVDFWSSGTTNDYSTGWSVDLS